MVQHVSPSSYTGCFLFLVCLLLSDSEHVLLDFSSWGTVATDPVLAIRWDTKLLLYSSYLTACC